MSEGGRTALFDANVVANFSLFPRWIHVAMLGLATTLFE